MLSEVKKVLVKIITVRVSVQLVMLPSIKEVKCDQMCGGGGDGCT